MATEGQPLKGRHAVLLYSLQDVQGTAVTPATALGIATVDVQSTNNLQAIRGLGSAGALFLKEGGSAAVFNFTNIVLQTSDFLELAKRASGVLPWFTLAVGYTDDAGTSWAWQIQDCKADQISMSIEGDNNGQAILTGSLSGTGGAITEPTNLVQANLAQSPIGIYELTATRGGAGWECKRLEFSVNNNVAVDWTIRASAPGSNKRGWSYQTEGALEVTGSAARFAKSGINLQADSQAASNIALAAASIQSGDSFTFTATGAKIQDESITVDPQSDLLFPCNFQATGFTLA